jgi:D-methionine transport system substrate-binding protein
VAVESAENNPYANLIVVREENKDRPEVKALVEVLQSEPIRQFIEQKYNGAVIPVAE